LAGIALLRVDDRLIHGQVVVKWLRYLACDEIWVVDDDLWADDFMQRVLRLAAPPSVTVHVSPVLGAPSSLQRPLSDDRVVLLLVRSPQTALELLDQGLEFSELNVGGLASGPHTIRIYKSVSATPEQITALRCMQDRGVRVYFQMVPEERPVEMAELLSAQRLQSRVSST
jgi:mannose/fructose/N-acetylgalactosamine-specific phosphotransferase system component IIB